MSGRGEVTLSVDTRDMGIRVGDRLRISDGRSRWRRFWDWLLRRPKPQLDFVVTGAQATVLTVAPKEER